MRLVPSFLSMYDTFCQILQGRRKYQYSDAMYQKKHGSNVFVVFCGRLERKNKRIKGLDVHLLVLSAAQDLSIKETLLRIYFLPSFLPLYSN